MRKGRLFPIHPLLARVLPALHREEVAFGDLHRLTVLVFGAELHHLGVRYRSSGNPRLAASLRAASTSSASVIWPMSSTLAASFRASRKEDARDRLVVRRGGGSTRLRKSPNLLRGWRRVAGACPAGPCCPSSRRLCRHRRSGRCRCP